MSSPFEAVSGDFTPVALRDVEQALGRHLKASQGPGEDPVIQARMSNLIIYCQKVEQARRIADEVDAIIVHHPCRLLLLVGEGGPESGEILTGIRARCRLIGRRHVCSEQVLLQVREASIDRLPFAVRSLSIGDLPTNVWWAAPQPPPLAGPILYELTEYAQQLVYDSQGWQEPHRGVALTAAWLAKFERGLCRGSWRVASDLNWRRLKFWRRLLGQAFNPASAPGAAESISDVLVEHGPHAVTQAWELVGWMAAQLGWRVQATRVRAGVEISWQVEVAQQSLRLCIRRLPEGPAEVRHVRIACKLEGKPVHLDCVIEDGQRLASRVEGMPGAARTVNLQPSSEAEVVARQLSDREPDPVFQQAMAVAQLFAQSVLA